MRAIQWMALFVLAICLIISGFEGRLGSFLAAFVAPAALETQSGNTNLAADIGTFVPTTSTTSGGA